MKKSIATVLSLIIIIVFSGCSTSYRPINPPTLNYNSHDLQDGVELSYKYDVLREKGNKKYANKEIKKGVKLIAIKVTNHTGSVMNMGRDAAFFSGQNQIFPMEPIAVKKSIRQITPAYLPYLLLSFSFLSVGGDAYPIGIALGPGLTIGNMLMAGSANKKMLNELYEYNILSRDIQDGETVYGIIGVRDMGYIPLTIKMIK